MTRTLLVASVAAGLLLATVPAQAQTAARPVPYRSQKAPFVEAFARFMGASAGTYGDEAARITSSLDAMRAAAARWDEAIAGYAVAIGQGGGQADDQADSHVALAAVYLDRGRAADALPELAAALMIAPTRPELHVFQGLAYRLAGQPEKGVASFSHATSLDPDEPGSFYELALLLRALGRDEEATHADARFRATERRHLSARGPAVAVTRPSLLQGSSAPVFVLARYTEGAALLRQGAYGRAVQAFEKAAVDDPLVVAARSNGPDAAGLANGSAALRRGALHDALTLLTTAVETAPTSAEAHRRLGMAYWADERYDRSAEHLQAAVELAPGDERARLALADVLETSGHQEGAERALLETIAVLPQSGQAHYRLGRLYHTLERYQEAVRAFEAAAALEPLAGLDTLHQIVALTEMLQQNGDRAVEAYRRQIIANPNDAAAHRALAGALVDLDRYDEALTEYLAALMVDPEDAAAFEGTASIYLQRQQYADAVAAARRALEVDDSRRQAQYALATSLVRLGRAEEGGAALARFRRMQEAALVTERRAYELDALRREASLSLERGDDAAAVGLLEQVLGLEPDSAVAHLDLGRALLRAGRPQAAIASFERALALDAETDVHRQLAEAYRALGRAADEQRHLTAYERQKADRLQRGSFR